MLKEYRSLSFGAAIAVNWALMLGLLLTSTIAALALGWSGSLSLTTWRFIKLLSNVFGAVGMVVFISNVELAIRSTTSDKATHRRLLEFIETKSRIHEQIAISCGNHNDELCNLARLANQSIVYLYIRDGKNFPMIGPAPSDTDGQRFYKDVLGRVQDMNETNDFATGVGAVLSDSSRVPLLLFGQFLIIIAAAGSVGEAAFQLRESKRSR